MLLTRVVSVATVLLASLTVSSVTLAAQRVAPLDQGTRIRVVLSTAPPQTLVGTVDMLSGDTLYVQTTDRIHHIPLATVSTLEVRRGTHAHAGMGALVGAGALGLVGLADGDDPPDQWFGMSAGQKALLGAVAGAGLGALIGVAVRSDKWEPVPLTSVRVAPVGLNRVGITLSLSF